MIKRSLKGKIIFPSVIILVFLVIVMTAYSSLEFLKFTSHLADENIAVVARNLKNYLKEYENHSKRAAVSVSYYPDVIKSVRERNTAEILRAVNAMLELHNVTYITITDETGTVLARSYEPLRFGDSAFHLRNIQDALNGKISTFYESGPLIKISVHTGAPIYDYDGALIGAISTGVRLDDNASMDNLKELLNADFSVILGDKRIATTITKDGERIIGTSLDPKIAKIMIDSQKEIFSYSDLYGVRYYTFFLPLFNAGNEVFAILAAGLSSTQLIMERNTLIINNAIIGITGLIFSIAVLLYIITKSLQPVNKLVRLVSDVTQGNINVDVDRVLVTNDEIGLLISDVCSLIDVIKSMLGDLSHLTQKLTVSGDVEFQLDTGKYSGSYKKIIDGIKALGDSILMKNKTMAVVDFLDTMIVVTDFSFNVLYVNQSLIDTYRIDRENYYKQKCYKFIRNFDAPCHFCRLSEVGTSPFSTTDYAYVFDECLGRWIGGKAAIIPWIDGSMVFCNYFSDKTELKNYEEQLHEAAYKAEAASIAKSAFLANMSHEIRTPMNSIMGFSELAMDSEVSPKTRDYLAKIRMNSEWLLQIINDILDISKIESGKMELEKIPFDMHELLSNCHALIMPKAVEKGIQIQFCAEPNMKKKPLGDSTRLRQALINLLSNAVKFTNTGTVELYSGIQEESEKTITVLFEVKDSGIGMTSEQIEKIFDPFTQAETGTTRKYGGTGLGLSITKSIVELMGGKLFVESTPGLGSKFSFVISFDTIDSGDDEMFSQKDKFKEIEKPVFKGEVLLCEDNVMNQQVICEHLTRVGLETMIADNGKIGVEMVRSRREKDEKQFDLVFMDMHMPEMDGLEASAKILEIDSAIPIVAMTASIMSGDLEIYKQNGMNDCIGKPFTSQELWRCLLKYLKPVSGGTAQKEAGDLPAADSLLEMDMEFKRSLEKVFPKNNKNKIEEIAKALEDGDIETAHRLAHSLKSNAAQIGKTRLQQAAADVENHLKNGENLVEENQLKILETELSAALNELSSLPES
jgi:signal transduction histidine kinase/DNA-binding response OmpR family regulator